MHQNRRLGLDFLLGWGPVRRTPGLINCSEARAQICAAAVDFGRLTGIRQWDRIRPADTLRAVLGRKLGDGQLLEGLPLNAPAQIL
jgi:hypothetical protein